MTQFRPLLGAKVDDLTKVRFPCFASAKIDGIRAIRYGPEFLSRTLKTIPNRAIQVAFAQLDIPSGWDGELVVGEPCGKGVFNRTDSKVMSRNLDADGVRFFVFDNCEATGGFAERLETVHDISPRVVKLDQHLLGGLAELISLEERFIREGYEGMVLRSPDGPYKNGRSTLREQYLLKIKRFNDAEAVIVNYKELLHNANEASEDQRGYTKRSKHQENLIPMGMLGAFTVRMGSTEFDIGSGYTRSERVSFWRDRDQLVGKLIKFKYLPYGEKDKPRHPIYLGFRSPLDI